MVELIDQLLELPMQIAYLIFYPVIAVIDLIFYLLDMIYIPLAEILNAIINLTNSMLSIGKLLLFNFLPLSVAGMLLVLLLLVIALRVWRFIGGISIFGVSLGGK